MMICILNFGKAQMSRRYMFIPLQSALESSPEQFWRKNIIFFVTMLRFVSLLRSWCFSFYSVAPPSNLDLFEETIKCFARPDAFFAAVICLLANGSELAGSHRQIPLNKTFSMHLPDNFAQLAQKIETHVYDWCSEKLLGFLLSVDAEKNLASNLIAYTGTGQESIPFSNIISIAIPFEWLI